MWIPPYSSAIYCSATLLSSMFWRASALYRVSYTRLNEVLAGISLLALSSAVKRRAMGAFPVHVKTLDALHLASALVYADTSPGRSMLIFSFDTGMNRCASALGFTAPFGKY